MAGGGGKAARAARVASGWWGWARGDGGVEVRVKGGLADLKEEGGKQRRPGRVRVLGHKSEGMIRTYVDEIEDS